MPRRNRVDPWGDLHATADRGLLTGNRGCLVDSDEQVVRHHAGRLWIACVLDLRGRRVGLARPGRWTPLFFLDDAVALAAGHRPCGFCRRDDHLGLPPCRDVGERRLVAGERRRARPPARRRAAAGWPRDGAGR